MCVSIGTLKKGLFASVKMMYRHVGVPTSPPCGEEGFSVLERCGAGLVDCGVVMIQ